MPYYRELGIDPDQVQAGPQRRPFNAEAAEVLSEFKPAVVSFHFGLPSADLVAQVKSWGSKVLSSATTLDEALWLEARGVDAIIAQGVEAGGHRGIFLTDDLSAQPGTSALVSQIVAKVELPVIAAGGIANAVDVAAAMKLGAAAVQIGTAYLLCPEATTSAVHRAALKSDAARHTELDQRVHGPPRPRHRQSPDAGARARSTTRRRRFRWPRRPWRRCARRPRARAPVTSRRCGRERIRVAKRYRPQFSLRNWQRIFSHEDHEEHEVWFFKILFVSFVSFVALIATCGTMGV